MEEAVLHGTQPADSVEMISSTTSHNYCKLVFVEKKSSISVLGGGCMGICDLFDTENGLLSLENMVVWNVLYVKSMIYRGPTPAFLRTEIIRSQQIIESI